MFYSYLYGIETLMVSISHTNISVLLVPLWNWNIFVSMLKRNEGRCFTRTFMELKLNIADKAASATKFYSYLYGIETKISSANIAFYLVLLVPLWNWNSPSSMYAEHIPSVLLVPLWNWNSIKDIAWGCAERFYSYLYGIETRLNDIINVTKSEFYSYLYGIETPILYLYYLYYKVLLVPLWNWNKADPQGWYTTSQFYSYLYGIETV